jgi:uncharacterized membrane protein
MIFVILFYQSTYLASILLLVLTTMSLVFWKSRATSFIFFFGAFCGIVTEVISVHYGLWTYSMVDFARVPLWLFFLWGNASIFIYRMAIVFEKLGIRR